MNGRPDKATREQWAFRHEWGKALRRWHPARYPKRVSRAALLAAAFAIADEGRVAGRFCSLSNEGLAAILEFADKRNVKPYRKFLVDSGWYTETGAVADNGVRVLQISIPELFQRATVTAKEPPAAKVRIVNGHADLPWTSNPLKECDGCGRLLREKAKAAGGAYAGLFDEVRLVHSGAVGQ